MKKTTWLLGAALAALATPAGARAELLIGLTAQNSLVAFDSASPGTAGGPVAITGLAPGESIVGIDIRPATGQLYGLGQLGASHRLFVIDPVTGAATPAPPLSVPLSGNFFGFDFNPVADRLRVVSDTTQNYRINVDTGEVLVDGALAYPAAGDPASGSTPMVVAAAYTNSFPGATSTTLYVLDAALGGTLVVQNPPNDGALSTTGLLGLFTTRDASFDISGESGTAYAVLNGVSLVRVDLTTGAATQVGAINTPGLIIGLAAPVGAGAIPEPGSLALVGIGLACLLGCRWRRRRKRL